MHPELLSGGGRPELVCVALPQPAPHGYVDRVPILEYHRAWAYPSRTLTSLSDPPHQDPLSSRPSPVAVHGRLGSIPQLLLAGVLHGELLGLLSDAMSSLELCGSGVHLGGIAQDVGPTGACLICIRQKLWW